MSQSFEASYEEVSRIPTCVQAGYAVGLFLICPLGDSVRRRQLVLGLILCTTLLSIGLAVTRDVIVFEVLSFFVGLANVAPQILIPLVAEIAPQEIRAFAFSLTLTGLMFGILLARVVAGLVAEFFPWRVVYYAAIIIQALVLTGLYFTLPDYPAKGADPPSWRLHWSTLVLAVTEPIAVQVILINIGASACFSYYWVTLTFLLGGPPYNYSTVVIGLFGLLGMAGVAAGPISGRLVDHIRPWHSLLLSITLLLVFQAVQVVAGGIHISAVIVSCFGLDFVQQIQTVALATYIFSISIAAISRLNALYMISFYVGQIIGSSVGTAIFIRYGWRASALFGLGLYGFQLCVVLARGPNCTRHTWLGYEGGISFPSLLQVQNEE
uniref:Major facilitator superfamily (MFS) profile domain-containing protein n=1 Tax=Psilocybe cubensis TaxID=181762 RepID=A0A8H7XK98_PSICU